MRSLKPNRRATEADRILSDAFDAARRESPQPASSIAVLRSRSEARADTAGEHAFMSTVTRSITSHRSLSYGMIAAVLVFALATLVPFEYQHTIGYTVTYDGVTGGSEWTPAHFTSLLQAMGYENASVQLVPGPSGKRCIISGLPSQAAVREANGLMASAAGFDGTPLVEPVRETVSGSLYAQVKEGLDMESAFPTVFSDLDLKHMSEVEIKSELRKRLEDRGCTDADITVTNLGTGDDGLPKREVMIKVGKNTDGKACLPAANLNLDDLGVKDPSKTDDEVIALVKERLAQNGMSDAKVSVIRGVDGERQIMIMQGADCK